MSRQGVLNIKIWTNGGLMIRYAIAFLALVSLSACTKKNPNQIAVESPFQFVYDSKLVGTDFVAELGKDQITVSQLFSPSPALTELDQRIKAIVMRKLYPTAEAGSEVTFAFAQPEEDLKKFFAKQYKEDVKINFDQTIKTGIAVVNGKTITIEEVAQGDMLISRLMQSRFEQSISSLEGFFARRKILEESKAANVPMEQYINEKVLGAEIVVTDQDVENFIKKNNISEKELTEALRVQIKDTIKSKERDYKINQFVGKNLIKEPIRVSFYKPTMKLSLGEVDSRAPHYGQGPISIMILSRWDCNECQPISAEMTKFVASYSKYFKMSYLFNFPTNSNEERMISEASLCLKKQNDEFFWKFAGQFDSKANENLEESINMAAKATGADFEGFRSCFLAREFKDDVEMHLTSTQNLGFYRNPVVVIDGRVHETPNTQELIAQALDLKAEKGLGFNFFYNFKKMLFGK